MAQTKHYGLVEAGGTKLVLGLARSDPAGPTPTSARDSLIARHTIPTTTPPETLGAAVAWLRDETARRGVTLAALGIASFGPLELSRHAPDWGHITRTTKPHWSNTDIAGTFARAFACPVAIDTDVNGAALAEARWGAGAGLPAGQDSLLYLTIGTGVGGGFVTGVKGSHGRLLHGLSHPEMGHIYLPAMPMMARSPVPAHSMAPVWKGWRLAPPSSPAGAPRCRICPQVTRGRALSHGIWRMRCAASRRCWSRPASCWAAGSWPRPACWNGFAPRRRRQEKAIASATRRTSSCRPAWVAIPVCWAP